MKVGWKDVKKAGKLLRVEGFSQDNLEPLLSALPQGIDKEEETEDAVATVLRYCNQLHVKLGIASWKGKFLLDLLESVQREEIVGSIGLEMWNLVVHCDPAVRRKFFGALDVIKWRELLLGLGPGVSCFSDERWNLADFLIAMKWLGSELNSGVEIVRGSQFIQQSLLKAPHESCISLLPCQVKKFCSRIVYQSMPDCSWTEYLQRCEANKTENVGFWEAEINPSMFVTNCEGSLVLFDSLGQKIAESSSKDVSEAWDMVPIMEAVFFGKVLRLPLGITPSCRLQEGIILTAKSELPERCYFNDKCWSKPVRCRDMLPFHFGRSEERLSVPRKWSAETSLRLPDNCTSSELRFYLRRCKLGRDESDFNDDDSEALPESEIVLEDEVKQNDGNPGVLSEVYLCDLSQYKAEEIIALKGDFVRAFTGKVIRNLELHSALKAVVARSAFGRTAVSDAIIDIINVMERLISSRKTEESENVESLPNSKRGFTNSDSAAAQIPIQLCSTLREEKIERKNMTVVELNHSLWMLGKGEACRIALLDTGVMATHPLLLRRVVDCVSFVPGHAWDDAHGHGTFCAGVIAQYAPKCELYVGKVLYQENDRWIGNVQALVEGIKWAVKNQCHVISLSVGASCGSAELLEAISCAQAHNIHVICAAANDGVTRPINIAYPAKFGHVICVGSCDEDGHPSSFSSRGREIDFVSYGTDVSAAPRNQGAEMICRTGTSVAVPFVASVVVIMSSWIKSVMMGRDMTCWEMKELLHQMCRHYGVHNENDGYGRLQLFPKYFRRSFLKDTVTDIIAQPVTTELWKTGEPFFLPDRTSFNSVEKFQEVVKCQLFQGLECTFMGPKFHADLRSVQWERILECAVIDTGRYDKTMPENFIPKAATSYVQEDWANWDKGMFTAVYQAKHDQNSLSYDEEWEKTFFRLFALSNHSVTSKFFFKVSQMPLKEATIGDSRDKKNIPGYREETATDKKTISSMLSLGYHHLAICVAYDRIGTEEKLYIALLPNIDESKYKRDEIVTMDLDSTKDKGGQAHSEKLFLDYLEASLTFSGRKQGGHLDLLLVNELKPCTSCQESWKTFKKRLEGKFCCRASFNVIYVDAKRHRSTRKGKKKRNR